MLTVIEAQGVSILSQVIDDKEILGDFYNLLESIQLDSSADQISALQDFLRDHPTFERVYLKLLERHLFYEKTQEAKAYFQHLISIPTCRRNGYWMLAKLSSIENDPTAAFKAFSEALHAGYPSLLLLKDFIEFDQQQAGKFDGLALLRKLGLKSEIQKLVLAFYNYQKLDYKSAIKTFSQVPQEVTHNSVVLHTWGECFYRLAHYGEADSLWHFGLASSKNNNDKEGEAQFLTNLGILAGTSHKYERELEYYSLAYEISSKIGDLFRIQLLLGLRAYSCREQGDYSEAVKYSTKAINIASKIGAYRYLVSWYWDYQQALYYLGEFDAALYACEKIQEFADKTNNAIETYRSKRARGVIYVYLKQYVLAKKTFQEAYSLAKFRNLTKEQQEIKVRLANLIFLEGNYAVARKIYQEVINSQDQKGDLIERAYRRRRLGRTYELEARYHMAKKEYLRSLALARETDAETAEAWSLLFLGNTDMMLDNFDKAIQSYHLVQEIALKQKNTEMLWQVFLSYGNAYRKAGDLNKAIVSYRHALEIIETARKDLKVDQLRIGYFREGNQVYRHLAQCFLQRYEAQGNRNDLDSLFYYDEMGRGRALQDLKIRENAVAYSNEFLQAKAKVQAMQHRLRQEAEKYRSSEEWNNLLAELEVARYSMLAQQLRGVEKDSSSQPEQKVATPTLPQILQALKSSELGLLFYHISPEAAFVLAAHGDTVKSVRLPVDISTLRSAIDSLTAPFHHVDEKSVQTIPFRAAIAHRLYNTLIKPVEAAMALPPRLLIVPDLALMNLPFEMLLTEMPDAAEYTPADAPTYAKDFLVQRYTTVYSPSTSLLLEHETLSAKNSNALIFANAFGSASRPEPAKNTLRSMTGWRFDPLPYAEVEAKRIQEIQPQAQVHKRENAAKTDFLQQAPHYQIVHMATHAFVDTTFDSFSGLVLAAGNDSTDDGLLMGYEIADLRLHCELVTLSACETGRGEVVQGEGVLGLPRLFLGAGAKSVLMTLWKVDDKFTSELMPVFYDNLLKHNLSKADALSKAKRMMLGRREVNGQGYYQHPFYWAAFTLFGDAGALKSGGLLPKQQLSLGLLLLGLLGASVYFYLRQQRMVRKKLPH